MKRLVASILLVAVSLLFGCQDSPSESYSQPGLLSEASSQPDSIPAEPVSITVVTSYGGDDGNRKNFENAYKAYEKATGNVVKDQSGTSNQEWKAKVLADFQTGAEPDVLFFFNSTSANDLVRAEKVVSIDEIREKYPDYASNMHDNLLGASPVDGKNYSVPVNGIWEGLYVNKKVLAACGVALPGPEYTWEQFLADCETIKSKGFTPIACSLQEIPHYWFEYCVMNNEKQPGDHILVPESSTDPIGQTWAAGMYDIKDLYERGYFPSNTLTVKDPDTFQLFNEGQAAFALDGSWKVGIFQQLYPDRLDDFTVTYVPAKNNRKPTDVIAGITMGYYITRKAWDDPSKQKACVDFVTAMTTDEVVSTFGEISVTALKNRTVLPERTDTLVRSALDFIEGATNKVPAVQDYLSKDSLSDLFSNLKNVVTGNMSAEAAIDHALAVDEY